MFDEGKRILHTKYDYLGDNKRILSHDGKTPSILIIPGFNGDVLQELGAVHGLKGRAKKDYEDQKNSGCKDCSFSYESK